MTLPPTDEATRLSAESETGKISAVLRWHGRLIDRRLAGLRARLRRARSRSSAAAEPLALELLRMLPERDAAGGLDLARVLAHVSRHDGRRRLMQQAGWKRFPVGVESQAAENRPVLSEVRFRRLLQTEPGEPWVTAMIRLVQQLDGVANVDDVRRDFLAWYDPDRREAVKIKWAKDYYAVRQSDGTVNAHSE